jgi:hypothetical protein
MLALEEKCIHPTSQTPYIKSFSGGKNNSPEGHAVGGLKTPYQCLLLMRAKGPLYTWLRCRV